MKRKTMFVSFCLVLILCIGLIGCGDASSKEAEALGYVTPDEELFTYEPVKGGVGITGFTGEDTTIQIPKKLGGKRVVSVLENAFMNSIVERIWLPDTVKTIENNAFFCDMVLKEVHLNSSVTSLGDSAFYGCVSLDKIDGMEKVKNIGANCFSNCPALIEITLPKGLKDLGEGAFLLSGLKSVTIPKTVTQVGDRCFHACEQLEQVVIEGDAGNLPDDIFFDCPKVILSGNSSVETYAKEQELDFLPQK